jgi:hypothetical protein
MDWSDGARRDQAELLHWLVDEYKSGRITGDMTRRFGDARTGCTALQIVRAITDLVGCAEDVQAQYSDEAIDHTEGGE